MSAKIAFVLLALTLPASSYSHAQVNDASPQTWAVNCSSQANSPELVCTTSQTILIAETGQRVARAMVSRSNGALTMTLALPHGLNIGYGVKLANDNGKPHQLSIVTADQHGAYAELPLTDAALKAMVIAEFLTLTVKAYRGEEVTLTFSLKGFSAALGKI